VIVALVLAFAFAFLAGLLLGQASMMRKDRG
jgi:hypothetical protein